MILTSLYVDGIHINLVPISYLNCVLMTGMTSQLLATALKHEKPELEVRKSELLKVEEEHKLEIGRLEDFLLEELANATGNLLENKELLASLNETKAKSASIQVCRILTTTLIFAQGNR